MIENVFIALGVGFGLLVFAALIFVGPWLSIIAVNQLFGTTIQLTFWNWLAAFWLHFVVASHIRKS